MSDLPRKKSPRAPSLSLDEALDRAGKAYDKERLQPAPTDVVAQNIGYKGANNGAALSALAALRYYGLMDRPRDGLLAVAKDYEAYRYAPSDEIKRSLLLKFLRTPSLFADLLDKYVDGFPADPSLKYELIQRGFLPSAASSLLAVLKRSVEFVGHADGAPLPAMSVSEAAPDRPIAASRQPKASGAAPQPPAPSPLAEDLGCDRIPVRLTGGRRAWLLIPPVFYAADKQRLKAQIDLLLTEDDDVA